MTGYNISPTLVQCFGIVLLGYLTGKLKFVTQKQGKGIGFFIGSISLPALIFKAMVQIHFKDINWSFWLSLLLAKFIVFFVVMVVTLCVTKTSRFAAAGLLSIFVSQSNDIAFGLPLLSAVFHDPSTKDLVNYVYMAAPISLAILNPIGFALLEYQKAKDNQAEKMVNFKQIVLKTVKGVVTNPLVFMIVFGIIFNFILNQQIPTILVQLFDSLSSAFGATALFFLGWKLGCQQASLVGLEYALPIILVLVKSVFLPIIMTFIVAHCTNGDSGTHKCNNNDCNTTMEYKNDTGYKTYAFLYGTIPTAPTVLVYAAKYNYGEQLVGSGLIIGTIFSAPVIFASIRMLQVKNMVNVQLFDVLIGNISQDVSIASLIFCVYVQIVMLLLRWYRKTPHLYTMILVTFQFLLALMGALFKTYSNLEDHTLRVIFFFMLFALFSCPIWCSMIAIKLTMIARNKSISSFFAKILHLVALGIPMVLALVIALTIPRNHFLDGDSYFYMYNCFKHHPVLAVLYCVINISTLVACIIAFVSLRKINHIGRKRKSKEGNYESFLEDQNSTGFVLLTTVGFVVFLIVVFFVGYLTEYA